MPIISKVGVASILDQMPPFSVQILGTTLLLPMGVMYCDYNHCTIRVVRVPITTQKCVIDYTNGTIAKTTI